MAQAPNFNCCQFIEDFSRILSLHSCYPQITEEDMDTEEKLAAKNREYEDYRSTVHTQRVNLLGVTTSSELSGALNLLPQNLHEKINHFYLTQIQQATSRDAVERCAQDIFQDILASSMPPIKVAARGVSGGPTFLVTYSRYGMETSKVIKWTLGSELDSQRVYQVFLSTIDNRFAFPCLVPKAGMIDEISPQHKTYSGETLNLSPDEHVRLRQDLDLIRNLGKPNSVKKGDQVFICDKVPGATLFDFIPTQYTTLSAEEKVRFYRTIGQIGALDYVLGNADRFIHETVLDDGRVTALEANLGNVMIQRNPLRFHLIDNGLIFTGTDATLLRNRSSTFFGWRTDPERTFETFRENLQQSILNACNIETIPNFAECRQAIDLFKRDVREFGPSITEGLRDMDQLLRQTLIPAWQQSKADFHLCQQTVSVDLTAELNRRFQSYLTGPTQEVTPAKNLYVPPHIRRQREEEAKMAAANKKAPSGIEKSDQPN